VFTTQRRALRHSPLAAAPKIIMRFRVRDWLLCLCLVLLAGTPASAQFYFGKNKVQYTEFDWMMLTTEHFDIYFYEAERELAEVAAEAAERSYDILADRFSHEVTRRIPLIIYSSPNFFSETNVVPSLLPENVGGFTEFLKGRVVLPFNGSYPRFKRVLQHELVHVFTLSKIEHVTRAHKRLTSASPPLWFTEGIAEFYSGPWSTDGDMVLSDLVLSGRLSNLDGMLPINGTFLMYKAGESFFHFLEEKYGTDYILRIFGNWWRARSFEEIVQITFGKPLSEIGREWGYWLKKKYFPIIEDRELPDRAAVAITKSGYNVKPVPLRLKLNGKTEDWIAFKGNRLGYAGLYMTTKSDGKRRMATLLRGERSTSFESLHLLGSALDAAPDGRHVAFSSKKHERDVLYVLDAVKRHVVSEYDLDSLYVISSPSFSPDGKLLVFSGCHKDGIHDLYLFDTSTESVRQLTHDVYLDADPVFTPDGGAIIFASDRGRYGQDGYMNLFRLTLVEPTDTAETDKEIVATGESPAGPQLALSAGDAIPITEYVNDAYHRNSEPGAASPSLRIEAVSEGRFNDRSPAFSPDGKDMVFSSDRDGRFNIYRRNADGSLDRLTDFATSALDPRYMHDGKEIVLTGYQNSSFQIMRMPLPDSADLVRWKEPAKPGSREYALDSDSAAIAHWRPVKGEGNQTEGAVRYRSRFSFDIAQSAVSFDAFYGTLGGFQTALTDILGNHQYYFLLANNADSKDDFFKSFNVAVNYINRTKRLNYGYGLFHLYDEYDDPVLGPLEERQYGAALYFGYPLSKFRRFETSLFLRQSRRQLLYEQRKRQAVLATQFISFVQDNSLWDISGPIDGHRLMISLGFTADLTNLRSFNRLAIIDARKYFRLGRYSAFATRILGHFSSGVEPLRRYLGGSWDLRGYPRRSQYARNVVLISNELRFPFIDALFVGFPVASLGFQAIRGAVFFDAGNAWEDDFGRMQGALGVGARVSLGYFVVLRFDWARRTDFKKIDDKTRFEFFFGWNF
jgi:Tol biopolymer transport system component